MIKLLKIVLSSIAILLGSFALYLLFMTVTDYKPVEKIALEIDNKQTKTIQLGEEMSAMIFNIGYAGLDQERDFFFDGGKESRSFSKPKTLANLEGAIKAIKAVSPNIIMLQEVDQKATRSFNINEYALMNKAFPEYASTFAYNYKVPWVPLPVLKPHGVVNAGMATYSQYDVATAVRYQYPGEFPWPKQQAMLDRCFIEMRMPTQNGKELVMINNHLSAYDKVGEIRRQELGYLQDYLKKEQAKGNYIIVGGDWNHLIPGTDPSVFKTTQAWPDWLVTIPDDFLLDGFKWVADGSTATNRSVDVPYTKGVNFLSVIDGFLVSSNVEMIKVKGIDLGFEFSDHNPEVMTFKLK
jgi:endonuclease/exonuclease/phosphatase family metal-dependent hydrolase